MTGIHFELERVRPNFGTLNYKSKPQFSKKSELQMSRIQRAFRKLPQSEPAEPLPIPIYTPILGIKVDGVQNH